MLFLILGIQELWSQKFQPLNDRVLIELIEEDSLMELSNLPESDKDRPLKGKVVAVGVGKLLQNGKRAQMLVQVDDIVVFGKYAGSVFYNDEKEFIILREDDILGIIED